MGGRGGGELGQENGQLAETEMKTRGVAGTEKRLRRYERGIK